MFCTVLRAAGLSITVDVSVTFSSLMCVLKLFSICAIPTATIVVFLDNKRFIVLEAYFSLESLN